MTEPEIHVTSQLYWIAALVTSLVDIGFVTLHVWRIKPYYLDRLKWPITLVAVIFWIVLWYVVMWDAFFWETCYQYIFSPMSRWLWPPLYGLIAGGIALFLWWLAYRLPGNPILNFLLLGGLDSFPGHLWAIYRRKLMETPLLKDVSVASALTFGFFEFVFYWCVILSLAALLKWICEKIQQKKAASHLKN